MIPHRSNKRNHVAPPRTLLRRAHEPAAHVDAARQRAVRHARPRDLRLQVCRAAARRAPRRLPRRRAQTRPPRHALRHRLPGAGGGQPGLRARAPPADAPRRRRALAVA
eukprot:3664345-Prymnesium_polylepis.1